MILHLVRLEVNIAAIVCRSGFICYALELPWLDNKANVSCIPDGDYDVVYMARSASGKYRDVYHVKGVSGRSGILIHKGNTEADTLGCILPGSRIGTLGGKKAVLGSGAAIRKLHKVAERKPFTLKVRTLF